MASSRPSILISGAGPAGLTLACILQRHGIPVSVFERDASATAREQGGTLDLHADSGQRALRDAGLLERFLQLASVDAQDTRVFSKDGALLVDEVTPPGQQHRPEIDRGALRGMLLDAVAPGTVRWGAGVDTVQAFDGRYRVHLTDGASALADIVIGADGAFSRVRRLLTEVRPQHCGVTFVELRIADIERRFPALAQLAGRGSMFALDGARGLITQRNGDASLRVYLVLRSGEHWIDTCGIDWSDAHQARAQLAALLPGWSALLLDFILQADDAIVPRPILMLPVGHQWPHQRGLTLVGDAAHLMSPFTGQGVNMALQDAAELGAVLRDPAPFEGVRRYERAMLARAADFTAVCFQTMQLMLADDAPRGLLEHMRTRQAV